MADMKDSHTEMTVPDSVTSLSHEGPQSAIEIFHFSDI